MRARLWLGLLALVTTFGLVGARSAGAQYIDFTQAPASPYAGGATASVSVLFGGMYGEYCEPDGWGGCYYYAYDDRVNASTFQFTVNGGVQTLSVQSFAPDCDLNPDGTIECTQEHLASGTASVSTSQHNTLVATVQRSDGLYWVSATHEFDPQTNGGPLISLAPHNAENLNVALCADACGDLVVTHTTPAYVSMDTPRSVTLVYHSGTARPMIQVEADFTDVSGTATSRSIVLKRSDGVRLKLVNDSTEIFFTGAASGPTRVTAIADMRSWNSWASTLTLEGRQHWSGASHTTTTPVRVLVHNRIDSPYGAGWGVAGYERITSVPGVGMMLRRGDGSIQFFGLPPSGSSEYVAPAGELTSLRWITCASDGACFERTAPDGTRWRYEYSGRLIAVLDRLGDTTTFTFADASSDRISRITDPAGKTIDFEYRPAGGTWKEGSLAFIRDGGASGRTTEVRINGSNDLVQIVDPDNVYAMLAAYDTMHRMTCRRDRLGYINSSQTCAQNDERYDYAYDAFSKLASVTLPGFTQHGGARVRPVVQNRSRARALFSDVNPVGVSSFPKVDGSAVRQRVTDPRGYVTSVAVNRFGSATRIEEPLGRTTVLERNDVQGRVTRSIGPSGHTVTYAYTGPNLTSTYDAVHGWTRMYYSGAFNQLDSTFAPGDSAWYTYDAVGNLKTARTGTRTAPLTTYAYYTSGSDLHRLASVSDGRGHTLTYTYESDTSRNLQRVAQDSGASVVYYDAYGRDTLTVDPESRRSRTSYDGLNRVVRSINNAQDTTTVNFAARTTLIQDPIGQTYKDSVDALGQVHWTRSPRGAFVYTYYDLSGNVSRTQNRRNQTVAFTYDALNQLASRTADGATTTYATDPAGRWTATANAASVDTLKFDAAGRPSHEVTVRGGVRHTLTLTHDGQDRLTAFVYGATNGWGAANSYRYNARGQLAWLRDVLGDSTTFEYDDDGLLTRTRLPNGVRLERGSPFTHAPSTMITRMVDGAAYTPLSWNIGRDLSGRLRDRVNYLVGTGPRPSRSYLYNSASRLIRSSDSTQYGQCAKQHVRPGDGNDDTEPFYWDCSGVSRQAVSGGEASFTYDRVGNPLEDGVNVWVDSGNRLVGFHGDSMLYDGDGNMVSKYRPDGIPHGNSDPYVWYNALGQVDSVWTPAAGYVRYDYDGWGRRIAKRYDSGAQANYVYQGDDLFAFWWNGSIPDYFTYYPGVDRPHSVWRNYTSYYYVQDPEGNVAGVLNRAGGVVATYRYDPYGALIDSAGTFAQFLRFKAREYDGESGFYYMRARYYAPALGRFISEDPIGLAGGINPYAFGGGDPINFRDPGGMDAQLDEPGPCQSATWVGAGGYTIYETSGCRGNFIIDLGQLWVPGAIGGNPFSTLRNGAQFMGEGGGGRPAGPIAGDRRGNGDGQRRDPSRSYPKCLDAALRTAVNNGITTAAFGALYMGFQGQAAGARGGAALGAWAGGALGTAVTANPAGTVIGVVIGAPVGGWGGRILGGYIGAHVGAVQGFSVGAAEGFVQGLVVQCVFGGKEVV